MPFGLATHEWNGLLSAKRFKRTNTGSSLKDLVLDIDHNGMLIVIRTSPGAAQLIARLLDSVSKKEGILGNIAATIQFSLHQPKARISKLS